MSNYDPEDYSEEMLALATAAERRELARPAPGKTTVKKKPVTILYYGRTRFGTKAKVRYADGTIRWHKASMLGS